MKGEENLANLITEDWFEDLIRERPRATLDHVYAEVASFCAFRTFSEKRAVYDYEVKVRDLVNEFLETQGLDEDSTRECYTIILKKILFLKNRG